MEVPVLGVDRMTRNRTATPAIPCIFLQDAGGDQCVTDTGGYQTWDTLVFKTSDFQYVLDDSKITILRGHSGYYEITFEVSYQTIQKLREVKTSLYKNGVELVNSLVHTFSTGAAGKPTYRDEHVLHYIVLLNKDDYVQIKTVGSGSDVCTIAETSRLIIKALPMDGWDNNRGGMKMVRGGVGR